MSYSVKEIYYTLQGEGANAGRAAVFCRFAGCNLWSGREADRAAAACRFCDTDFVGTDGPGGGRFATPEALAEAVRCAWPAPPGGAVGSRQSAVGSSEGSKQRAEGSHEATAVPSASRRLPGPTPWAPSGCRLPTGALRPLVVCTGGEPLLQLDPPLIEAFHAAGFEVAVETNGTRPAPPGLDWICVSPKAGADLVQRSGDELKLVYPQPGAEPERFAGLDFRHFFLQPMDGPDRERNTQLAARYCLEHPDWRLSIQTHKLIGLP
jgi:7-carboxy-7-deazaguanine synthase